MMSNNPQRSRVFIKKAFQFRFILGVFALILLSGLCSALLIYSITADDLQAQSLSVHTSIANVSGRLGLSILIGNLVAIVVAGLLAVASVLYASHKIAGPLYRFETLCRQIGDGNLDGVTQLREKDQLQELAYAFSTMVTRLRDQRSQRSEVIATLYAQLSILQGSSNLTETQQEAVAKMLDALRGFD